MKTWEEISKDKSGTIYKDWFDRGIRCLIVRGPGALCAYLGIPENHPLANKDYSDLPLAVHGGLTFAGTGEGVFWYGWDYGHSGDYAFYYDEPPLIGRFDHSDEKKWTIEEIEKEVNEALWDFKRLVKLAENITHPSLNKEESK